jgi:hypothetical protein
VKKAGEPCCVCGYDTIAICPYCKKRVCPEYGWYNKNCGERHEASCPEARRARLGS